MGDGPEKITTNREEMTLRSVIAGRRKPFQGLHVSQPRGASSSGRPSSTWGSLKFIEALLRLDFGFSGDLGVLLEVLLQEFARPAGR
jgi:hypothetical protein